MADFQIKQAEKTNMDEQDLQDRNAGYTKQYPYESDEDGTTFFQPIRQISDQMHAAVAYGMISG